VSVGRLAGLVAGASLPLLATALGLPRNRAVTAALWAAGVALVVYVIWNAAVRPLGQLLSELGAETPLAAEAGLRELREEAARCAEARRELAGLLEDVSGTLGDGLLVVDASLGVRLANRAALDFLGRESLSPGTLLVEMLRAPEPLAVVRRAAEEGKAGELTVEHRRGLWEIRALPVRQGGAVVLLSEVTLLRRSAEMRRRFVQDLSHELRSPLAVLRTTVESLEGEVDPESAELLVRQVERITRLSEELHELATIESGELELKPEPVALAGLAADVLADLRPVAAGAEVALESTVAPELRVVTDRRALGRILTNLVENGIKYNRPGGWVRVDAAAAGGDLVLRIADSGEGIPAKEITAVFQRFYRVERGRTPGGGGLGLGLAIVKHLVRRLGGTLTVDSRVGVGTSIEIRLPGAAGDAAPVAG